MANGVFNIAKGKVGEYFARVDGNDPANSAIIIVLIKTMVDTEDQLRDRDTLAACLVSGTGANTEADFTNYARKVLTDSDITAPSPDDTNNLQACFIDDQTWASAGGVSDNTLARLLVCYDPDTTAGTDANIVPLTYHDFVKTTNGGNLTADFDGTNGVFSAA